jgi:hypothetical protein
MVRLRLAGATVALLVALVALPAAASATGPTTVLGPVVGVAPYITQVGSTTQVTVAHWPGHVVDVAICGDLAHRGSQDCDQVGSISIVLSGAGEGTGVLPVKPPIACPCVVRATTPDNSVIRKVPIVVKGVATLLPSQLYPDLSSTTAPVASVTEPASSGSSGGRDLAWLLLAGLALVIGVVALLGARRRPRAPQPPTDEPLRPASPDRPAPPRPAPQPSAPLVGATRSLAAATGAAAAGVALAERPVAHATPPPPPVVPVAPVATPAPVAAPAPVAVPVTAPVPVAPLAPVTAPVPVAPVAVPVTSPVPVASPAPVTSPGPVAAPAFASAAAFAAHAARARTESSSLEARAQPVVPSTTADAASSSGVSVAVLELVSRRLGEYQPSLPFGPSRWALLQQTLPFDESGALVVDLRNGDGRLVNGTKPTGDQSANTLLDDLYVMFATTTIAATSGQEHP